MDNTCYKYRYIARLTMEADTPIAVGSGSKNILTDSPVMRDVNGLPYIPATALAGVVRHAMGLADQKSLIFGYHDKNGGRGSQIIFTDAVMVGKEGRVLDGIQPIDWNDEFYSHYSDLSLRNHVRIDENGVAADTGKFDNEVVYKGTRLVFEMELLSNNEATEDFRHVVDQLYSETLRVGGGTRCGYGKLSVKRCEWAVLDLSKAEDLEKYIDKSSCLSEEWSAFEPYRQEEATSLDATKRWTKYELRLQPLDFFLFASGLGDDDADLTPATDIVVEWSGDTPSFSEERVLIPASSVKGALAHRTAYNYNKQHGLFVETGKGVVGGNNPAVRTIFGKAGDNGDKDGQRGNIIIDDLIKNPIKDNTKVHYHIKNDYFTGGTINGALFQEKSVNGQGHEYGVTILVDNDAWNEEGAMQAFEQSLSDLCEGLLPLGGCVGRGNGMFEGQLYKNGELWNK